MTDQLILAMNVEQFVDNGLEWIGANPFLAAGVLAVILPIVLILAGSAGLLPGGLMAIAGYSALSVAISFTVCGVVGSLNGNGEGPPPPPPNVKGIERIEVEYPGGSLRVEAVDDGEKKLESHSWGESNLESGVKDLCRSLDSGKRQLDVQWTDVPRRLRGRVREEFRLQGIKLSETE